MQAYIVGVTGAIGSLRNANLLSRGDAARGLVRTAEQQEQLAARGIDSSVGEIAEMSADELARLVRESDWVVFTAGPNGGARETTKAIDGDGVVKA